MTTASLQRLRCVLSVPPSVNGMYVRSSSGVRLHAHALAWRDEAVLKIRERLAGEEWPIAAFYRLTLRVWFPNERQRRDVDNVVKILQDSLAIALGFNDEQVRELHAFHCGYDRAHARCDVLLEVI